MAVRLTLFALLACLLAAGCTKYVPVETVRTEYRDRDIERLVTDTVVNDRFVMVKGDTVIDYRDRWHKSTEYVHDTCYVERTDSVPVPYPVERPLSRWEKAKMDFGGIAFGGVAVALCAAVVWIVKKRRRK